MLIQCSAASSLAPRGEERLIAPPIAALNEKRSWSNGRPYSSRASPPAPWKIRGEAVASSLARADPPSKSVSSACVAGGWAPCAWRAAGAMRRSSAITGVIDNRVIYRRLHRTVVHGCPLGYHMSSSGAERKGPASRWRSRSFAGSRALAALVVTPRVTSRPAFSPRSDCRSSKSC